MLSLECNNLDKATSPYLQQHKDNPIYWQEWSKEVLEYAQKNNKILFVSIGYATCHWCHVMANEAFSDSKVAEFLNAHFVSIKVDREQRPDIDQYCISFMQKTQGQGGWPLNVFMTPPGKPFFAGTYVPLTSRYGLPSFVDLLHQIKEAYEQQGNNILKYHPKFVSLQEMKESELITVFKKQFIPSSASFSAGAQFPPHTTLLFLLSYYEQNKGIEIKNILQSILDTMAQRGLQDHLQGGFFRYCVDAEWTIPHFEKMLYDQAMLLWVYSAAYKVFRKNAYKTVAEKIMACLEDTFANEGLYYTAHDADTNHQEGATYLWTLEELRSALTTEEFSALAEIYEITKEKNFNRNIHLLKKKLLFLPEIEKKLLHLRKKKAQPLVDQKYITSWNALIGIALLIASRYLSNTLAKVKAENLFKTLWKKHYVQGKVIHSSYQEKVQVGEFLEDYAALLVFATYLYEEDFHYVEPIQKLYQHLLKFKKKHWLESITKDFLSVPASSFDHPTPSSTSLAEMALLRTKIILKQEYTPLEYRSPLQYDFFNVQAFISKGNYHLIHTPYSIRWDHLPLNCLQIKDTIIQDCYQRQCMVFPNVSAVLNSLTERKFTH